MIYEDIEKPYTHYFIAFSGGDFVSGYDTWSVMVEGVEGDSDGGSGDEGEGGDGE